MKKLLASIAVIFFCINVIAQDAATLMAEGTKLETALNEKGAFEKFKAAQRLQPSNIQALNKCSELCSRIGNREATALARNDYYAAAQKCASAALKIDANNSASNCMMAIALGRVSLEKSGKEKVKAAIEIKKYADIAISKDAGNYKAWHVLGRWHYELSSLNFIERAAVKVFFGGLPKSSFADAITAFEKAKQISPGFVMNYYELARAYKKNGQSQKAIAAINTMLKLPDTTEDDAPTKKLARKLLESLQ